MTQRPTMGRKGPEKPLQKSLEPQRFICQSLPWWDVFCDGGARPKNPGPAGFGIVIESATRTYEMSRYLGIRSNNVAEYSALLVAVKYAKEIGAPCIDIKMDSKLVINQVLGDWKIKDDNLRVYQREIVKLLGKLWEIQLPTGNIEVRWKLRWIPRASNQTADAICTAAILGTSSNPFVRRKKELDPFA